MEQFEQLLTCAICLDRYRNPKLLPCQHSFCMEPCMDGLVDYVRRQVKCPECRAEHRIPYQGVQGYPTNVTLQRFLELHIEITGELPDPTSGQIMERCNVCSEKAYCSICVHCEKKICGDCKGAHMDILRREITRINNQIRRALHRLQDALALVEKNQCSLLQNCSAVSEEVDEIYRRLNKALKDRTEYLRGEIDRYLSVEQRNLVTLKENLEQEVSNIQSNCDLADKHMTENVEWDDCELMDAKEIFLKTVEFIRNFEYENTDYARRVRFTMAHDPNQLVLHVAGYGELTINMPHQHGVGPTGGVVGSASTGGLLAPPGGGPGLMRSKSDHRLASQFRQQEEEQQPARRGYGRSGGGGGAADDYRGEFESPYDNEGGRAGRRYRSRFSSRHVGAGDGDSDTDVQGGRSVRFSGDAGGSPAHHKERERVLDTEDVSRGPLSGITRLYDSPRVMKRLQESENRGKKKDTPAAAPAPAPAAPKTAATAAAKRTPAARQVSEDDEISRIKKQNKSAPGSSDAAAETPARPQAERVAALKQSRAAPGGGDAAEERDSQPASPTRRTPPAPEGGSSDAESDDGSPVSALSQRKSSSTGTKTGSRRSSTASDASPASPASSAHKKAARSGSSDSTTSSESSGASSSRATEDTKRSAASTTTTNTSSTTTPRTRANDSSTTSTTTTAKPFQSRFLGANRTSSTAEKPKDDDEESESESSSESEETDSEEESDDASKKKTDTPPAGEKTDIGALLARSQNARDTTEARRRDSRDDTSTGGYTAKRYGSAADDKPSSPTRSYQSRYGAAKEETSPTSKYLSGRTRAGTQQDEEPSSRYGSSGYTSRFLNKSKSSAALSPEEDSDRPKYGSARSTTTTAAASAADVDDSSRYPSGRSRYAALKDRRQRLARSRSSHNFGGGDDDDQDDSPSSPTSTMPSSYLPSRYGPGSSSGGGTTTGAGSGAGSSDLSRSRSTHALKSRENSPERGAGPPGAGGEKDGAALSSWARYLKNKYGNRGKDGKDGPSGSAAGSAAASATVARRLSLGLPLRHNSASVESSDDDQKNPAGSPTSPTAATAAAAAAGFAVAAAGSSPRSQYLQKRRQQFKVGSRGSEPGCFTWPRGIAVGPDNSIVVADSSNHRVQLFDSNGIFVKEFGTYGNGEGEFDCLAGVAVNRIGQFIIADRYNHRIQVMDPSGRFLRAFGSQGTADGRFNYPWGITTDALGFIYVCDKENHRVQVFQSDGTFVGKFGSCGSKPGQLEHPHYIAVSNTNRVIVSDSNNHRVQIFDVNGKVLTTFGTEGSDEGQFKFPRQIKKSKSSHRALGLPVKLSRSRSFKTSASSSSTKSIKPSVLPRNLSRQTKASPQHLSRQPIASPQNVPSQPTTPPQNPSRQPITLSQNLSNNPQNLSSYPTANSFSHTLSPGNQPIRSISPRARRARLHATRIASKAVIAAEGSGSRRSRLHLCGRLGEQPNTDLPPRRNLSPSFRMLGIGRRGVQGTGGNSSDVQWQHSSLRQGESQNTSILTSHPAVKPLPIRKSVHKLSTPAYSTSGSYHSSFNVPVAMPKMKTIVANTIQVNKRRPSLSLPSPPLLPPLMRYQR